MIYQQPDNNGAKSSHESGKIRVLTKVKKSFHTERFFCLKGEKMKNFVTTKGIRTAEYVSAGHPDKMCDAISDAILDAYLEKDKDSRVAVECMGGHGKLYIMGEITSKHDVDVKKIAQDKYESIGYKDKLDITVNIVKQSPNIALGVDSGGAGDQGIMIGYACSDNEEYLPQEYYLAKKIIEELPKNFGPDAKSQVTINKKNEVETIVISAQHKKGQDLTPLYDLAKRYKPKNILINPTGEFTVGGFEADTGLTGRKIVVDAYGPEIPVGGGAFSGKDYTKVDRSGAKKAREIALEILKKEKAQEVLVKLAYAIGIEDPVMATVEIDGKQRDIRNDYNLKPKNLK